MVFFGTPEFAVPSLQTLARSGFHLTGVVTQPDRAQGRGQTLRRPSPVARTARELGLPLYQPEKPSDPAFLEAIGAMRPDAFAVAAYGHILPGKLLALAPLGAWNVHPSLLPRWRGPAPIHRTISAGDEQAGVSIMKLAARLDVGPVARQATVTIAPHETRGDLEPRLAAVGADMLVQTLCAVQEGSVRLTDQDERSATYAAMFQPGELQVNWDQPAVQLDRLIRALLPAPGAHVVVRNARVKVLRAERAVPVPESRGKDSEVVPGMLLERGKPGSWQVACGEGGLWLHIVQPEGKSPMSMEAFIAGRRLKRGDILA